MTDILSRIDDTLTFYSAGLGVDLEVPVEREDEDEAIWFETYMVPVQVDIDEMFQRITVTVLDDWARNFAEASRAINAAWKAMGPAVKSMTAPLAVVSGIEAARRERLRRMHHLYWRRRVR